MLDFVEISYKDDHVCFIDSHKVFDSRPRDH